MTKKFPCFSSRLLLPIFQPSRPLSGNALKKKKAFRTPPAHVPTMPSDDEDALRLQRQIRRAVAETCGPVGIRELPAQDETARLPSSSSAASNSLKPEHSSPRRHSARTSGRCPCAARWDAVVTASCEAFCECVSSLSSSSIHPVTTTASCEAFCEIGVFGGCLIMILSQPQLAVKPSVRLAFFYPYISGSARAFFPGGG